LLSEAALSADWDRPEEEAAWSHLSQGRHGRLRRLAKPAAR